MVLNPIIDPIKKSEKLSLLDFLLVEDFEQAFRLLSRIHQKGFGLISSPQRFSLTHEQALNIAEKITECFVDSKNLVIYHPSSLALLQQEITKIFARNKQALISIKSLRTKLSWASTGIIKHALKSLLQSGEIIQDNGIYKSPYAQIQNIEDFVYEKVNQAIHNGEYAPMAPYNIYDSLDIDRALGDLALKKLCKAQKIKRLEHNLFISHEHLSHLMQILRNLIHTHGYLDVALIRDHLGLSRKYCVAYLDYLDQFGDISKDENQKRYRKA